MTQNLENLLSLRTIVLALGEGTEEPWWNSTFLSLNGRRFLASPFPRSTFWAALHAASTGAQRHHDERIGTGGKIHLFRLGPEMELRLREAVLRGGWTPTTFDLDDRDSLRTALSQLSAEEKETTPKGPVRVCAGNRFTGEKTLARVASLYASAFDNDSQTLPYASDQE